MWFVEVYFDVEYDFGCVYLLFVEYVEVVGWIIEVV